VRTTVTTRLLLTLGLVAAGVTAAPAAATAAGCTWTATTLPLLSGYTESHVTGAADGGWAVGSMSGGGHGDTSVRWHDGQVEDLGRALGKQTELRDVNTSGVAVGQTYANGDIADAVAYRGGHWENLPKPPNANRVRAKLVTDSGDIVGMTSTGFDDLQMLIWPAASPGTVQLVNPDPSRYYDVVPVDVDDQGRILIEATGGEGTDLILRHPDGTFTAVPGTIFWPTAYRNGRIVASGFDGTDVYAGEWDLEGHLVHRLVEQTDDVLVDSGGTIAGRYRTADGGSHFGVWEDGVLTHSLPGTPTGVAGNPAALTDGGVLVATVDLPGTTTESAVTYRRSC
jgi:hypothetical protein